MADRMKVRFPYALPPTVASADRSPAFRRFLDDYFIHTFDLTRGQTLDYLASLAPDELALARRTVRTNLHLRRTHLIEASGTLGDSEAVPLLSAMLSDEPELSRRITIAGALWRLRRDPVFFACLIDLMRNGTEDQQFVHMDEVLWLADQRAIVILTDYLDSPSRLVSNCALRELNELEFRRRFLVDKPPNAAAHYQLRRTDHTFLSMMATSIIEWYVPRDFTLGPFGLWTGAEVRAAPFPM